MSSGNNSQGSKEYEMVNLGLPSGTEWATHNVGASSPEEAGNYYAWGEIEAKKVYDEETYTYDDQDVAFQKWGSHGHAYWCIPDEAQWRELIKYCNWEEEEINGVPGYRVTGRNGNSIFLPGVGAIEGDEKMDGVMGAYWSASYIRSKEMPSILKFGESQKYAIVQARSFLGLSVRPVSSWERKLKYTPGSTVVNSKGTVGVKGMKSL